MTTYFRHPPRTARLATWLLALASAVCTLLAQADTRPEIIVGTTQGFLEYQVEEYLKQQNIEGRYEISINRLDPRLRLPDCNRDLEPSIDNTPAPIGRFSVKMRCEGDSPWTIYVPAQVLLYRNVAVAGRPLERGQVLSEDDISLTERDVGTQRQGFLTDVELVVGQKLKRPVAIGQIIAPSFLEQAEVIHKGDHVVINARTNGFSVRMQGEALADGAVGEQIRIRNLGSQRVIRARVNAPGEVEVAL